MRRTRAQFGRTIPLHPPVVLISIRCSLRPVLTSLPVSVPMFRCALAVIRLPCECLARKCPLVLLT